MRCRITNLVAGLNPGRGSALSATLPGPHALRPGPAFTATAQPTAAGTRTAPRTSPGAIGRSTAHTTAHASPHTTATIAATVTATAAATPTGESKTRKRQGNRGQYRYCKMLVHENLLG